MSSLRIVTPLSKEDEMELFICFTEASNLCSNFNRMDEQMTMFLEGLNPTNRTIVSQYWQNDPRVSFLRLVYYAKAQDAAIRARHKKVKKVTLQEPTNFPSTTILHPHWRPRGSPNPVHVHSEWENQSAYLIQDGPKAEAFLLGQTSSYSREYSEDFSGRYVPSLSGIMGDTSISSTVLAICDRPKGHTTVRGVHMQN